MVGGYTNRQFRLDVLVVAESNRHFHDRESQGLHSIVQRRSVLIVRGCLANANGRVLDRSSSYRHFGEGFRTLRVSPSKLRRSILTIPRVHFQNVLSPNKLNARYAHTTTLDLGDGSDRVHNAILHARPTFQPDRASGKPARRKTRFTRNHETGLNTVGLKMNSSTEL